MSSARLVLVHGTRFSRTQWAGYAPLLRGLDVVALDLPGHGRRVGERFTTDAAVAAIESAVEGGDPGVPVVLAGHSLGGYLATAYAARRPGRLAGLVLVGASAVPRGPGAAAYRGFATLVERVGHERAARAANRVIGRLAGADVLETLVAGGDTYAAMADAWDAVMSDCRPELLRAVRCPVLVLCGSLDQLGVHARGYARQCRDGRVIVVPRATHFLPLTHVELVAGLLREFVEEVTAQGADERRAGGTGSATEGVAPGADWGQRPAT